MLEIVTAFVVLGSLTALLVPLRRVTRLPLALTASMALALLVCFETLLVNALSIVHGVGRIALLSAHAILVAACLAPKPALSLASLREALARPFRQKGTLPTLMVILPLGSLAFLSATRYAPNNFDAMNYRLARVAHWIQNGSVGVYPTGIRRQVVLPAGSDYLLLLLQELSGSDRLANLLQLGCYVLVVFSAPALARLAGVPRRFAWFAAALVASLPMAILQASSAQNDLVASTMAVAAVAACLPFLHPRHRVARPAASLLVLTATLAAGLLVKPTAVITATPFVLLAGVVQAVRRVRREEEPGAHLLALLAAVGLGAAVCGPEILRHDVFRHAPDLAREFSYPLVGEWGDRAFNGIRGIAHHVPPPRRWAEAISGQPCAPGTSFWCVTSQFWAHEDLVGNPAQALIAIAAMAIAAIRGRQMPLRARLSVAGLACGWILFHALLRNNPWIQRLQLPLFVLQPLTLAALLPTRYSPPRGRRVSAVLVAAAIVLVGYAGDFAVRNVLARPFGPPVAYERSYYANLDSQYDPQEAALRFLAARHCTRLGLSLSELGYDYPLTWRAMQRGAAVRHVTVQDPWPCLLYSDRGEPPGARSAGWIPLEGPQSPPGKPASMVLGRER